MWYIYKQWSLFNCKEQNYIICRKTEEAESFHFIQNHSDILSCVQNQDFIEMVWKDKGDHLQGGRGLTGGGREGQDGAEPDQST